MPFFNIYGSLAAQKARLCAYTYICSRSDPHPTNSRLPRARMRDLCRVQLHQLGSGRRVGLSRERKMLLGIKDRADRTREEQ